MDEKIIKERTDNKPKMDEQMIMEWKIDKS